MADGERVTVDSGPLCSLLTVRHAETADTGRYGCEAAQMNSDSVHVDVIARVVKEERHVKSTAVMLGSCAYHIVFFSIAIASGLHILYI